MEYRSYSDLNRLIRKNVSRFQTSKYDLIVGIPRSGMLPAYMISLILNKKCCDIDSLINNIALKTGSTRNSKDEIIYPSDAKKILIIDDSICSGKSLSNEISKIPFNIREKITTLAVYTSEKVRDDVDITLEYVPTPRIFEWNIFHHSIVGNSCFDIDGVLCIDPTEEENDDGEKYNNFLLNALPYIIPTGKINSLVTSRLEKYRPETEVWLKNNGVVYENLLMLDLPTKEERQRLGAHASFKAEVYKKSGQELFYESDRNQAIKIHELTKKPVYCVDSNEFFNKNSIISSFYNASLKKSYITRIVKRLPKPFYNSIKYFYHLIR
ncbi:phosphoribosyltransferase [Paenibacillus lupini]|uniref:phosphoribosyltransferase n=1 Tax=Paenibacillus lupini TaxID=1450204 RepID=UPI00141F7A3C|nr:phosphoribosyltransferase [Paenibacillus lupini]NIK23008.1 putative HAD superfamily protein/hypoxanthine phosphoribosyltransferase [Paenibacillus lupini]